jgi:hypothetical protein
MHLIHDPQIIKQLCSIVIKILAYSHRDHLDCDTEDYSMNLHQHENLHNCQMCAQFLAHSYL